MKKIWGKFLYGLGKVLEFFLTGLLILVQVISDITNSLIRMLGLLILPGCLLTLLSPFFLVYLLNSWVFIALFTLALLPFICVPALHGLKKALYACTNYFYDKSEAYQAGKSHSRKIGDYAREYDRQEAEKARRRRQKQWEDVFNSMFGRGGSDRDSQNAERSGFGPGYFWWVGGDDFTGYRGTGGPGAQWPPQTGLGFKSEYEKNCKILGVPFTASYNDIKRAYRSLAKKYHPDINKEAGAKERFQEISSAYNFFTEEKVDQYKRMG